MSDLHTGNTALHGLLYRGVHALLNGFLVDGAYRTRQVGALHHTIAHHHDLAERSGVFYHSHIHHSGFRHLDNLLLVTNIGKLQTLPHPGCDLETAVDVGNRTARGSLHLYRRSDDLIAIGGVGNSTCDFHFLCQGRKWNHEE